MNKLPVTHLTLLSLWYPLVIQANPFYRKVSYRILNLKLYLAVVCNILKQKHIVYTNNIERIPIKLLIQNKDDNIHL